MFYFFLPSLFNYNYYLIVAAVVPALVLMLRVYRSDRIEKESSRMLVRLAVAGVLSSLIALGEERVLGAVLDAFVPQSDPLYDVILYFGIVAFAEETSKYLMLYRRTWHSPEFDCRYDGVVYAVFVSLGFALWENISYVMSYGLATAVVRAVTAIPGHACFGVFMGVFYGIARMCENQGRTGEARLYRVCAIVAPALLHGAYDYIASTASSFLTFVGFVAVLFVVSFLLVGKSAREDRYI